MKRISLLIILWLLPLFALSDSCKGVAIYRDGREYYIHDQPYFKACDSLWGIIKKSSGYALIKSKYVLDSLEDPDMPTLRFKTSHEAGFLFDVSLSLVPGAVQSYENKEPHSDPFASPGKCQYDNPIQPFTLEIKEYVTTDKSDEKSRKINQMWLVLEDKRELLYTYPYDYGDHSFDVVWCGDIDGDKRLDFILGLSERHYGEAYLFLSSLAKKNGVVGLAGKCSYSS